MKGPHELVHKDFLKQTNETIADLRAQLAAMRTLLRDAHAAYKCHPGYRGSPLAQEIEAATSQDASQNDVDHTSTPHNAVKSDPDACINCYAASGYCEDHQEVNVINKGKTRPLYRHPPDDTSAKRVAETPKRQHDSDDNWHNHPVTCTCSHCVAGAGLSSDSCSCDHRTTCIKCDPAFKSSKENQRG